MVSSMDNMFDFDLWEEFLIEDNKSKDEVKKSLELFNMSQTYFPNDVVYFYNESREMKASSPITCDISGSIIRKGTLYCYYNPLIQNKRTGTRYKLTRPIKIETSYEEYLPRDMFSFEELDEILSGDNSECIYRGIDVSHLAVVMGGRLGLKNAKTKNYPQGCGKKLIKKNK